MRPSNTPLIGNHCLHDGETHQVAVNVIITMQLPA